MATLEDASRCPICNTPGEERTVTKLDRRKGNVHFFWCVNERCRWFDTSWLVQEKEDGTIPERTSGPAEFKGMSNDQVAMGQRIMEDLLGKDLRGTDLDR